MSDSGLQAISKALLIENYRPVIEAAGLSRRWPRRVSKEERTRIVAECEQPGVCLTTVARRNRVPVDSLRRWVRLAGGGGVAKLEREDAAALPPFVPVVVDEGASAWARIATLTETAKVNGVEPYAYLNATLEAIAAGHPASRIDASKA